MSKRILQAVLGAVFLMVVTGADAGVRTSPRVSYSPARTSSTWSAPKSVAPPSPSLRSSANKAAQARAAEVSAPSPSSRAPSPSSSHAPAAAPSPTYQNQRVAKESSESFWMPFAIGYMMAPHSSHATETRTVVVHDNQGVPAAAEVPAPVAMQQETKKGPFVIDVPEHEFLDSDCKVKDQARDFIKQAKVEHSVLFMAIPENSRCYASRHGISGQIPEAVVVKSDNGHYQLSRHMGVGG